VSDPQLLALLAAWREDLRRARQALEALTVQGEGLAKVLLGPAQTAITHSGLVDIDRSSQRAPAAIAAALIGYLERGGHLDPRQGSDLARALDMARSRQLPTAGRGSPA
jgi:hypothetical protein